MEATANNLVPVIDQKKDLVHLNELVTEINDLKENYKDLTIDGVEDKAGYELVRAAIGVLRPKRTGLEAERKSVVKPYNDFVKHINGEYEKITSLIQDGPGGETELKVKKEAIDSIVEKQKEEEARQAEQKINNRINELITKGVSFDGNYYTISAPELGISETSIGVVDIRTMSDDLYSNFLQMVVDKSAKITAEKERVEAIQAKEKADKEAADKKEREEFEKQKKEIEDKFAEMKKQQDEIKAQQEALDNAKRDAELREQQAEQEKVNMITRNRSAILTGMGLKYNAHGGFDYNGVVLVSDALGIAKYDDAEWLDIIETLKSIIAKKKIEEEEFLKEQQQKEKEKLDLQEKERQAGLNDQQKIKEYIDALLAVHVPEFKTKKWKTIAAYIRDMITDNRPA